MHPNDTLNGLLLEFERESEKHLRSSLGYWRMVEERMIAATLVEEGHDQSADDFRFKIMERVFQNHANDQTHAERCRLRAGAVDFSAAAQANGWSEMCQRQQESLAEGAMEQDAFPRFLDALRRIAAGHNDPRALARTALGDFFSEE